MAPRPHHLVLRAVPARRALPGLHALPSGLRLPVQFLLRQRRARGTRAPSAAISPVPAPKRSPPIAGMSMPPWSKFFQNAGEDTLAALAPLIEVGLNHEQQHQELMLTDILHAFAQNPIPPAYDPAWSVSGSRPARGEEWVTLDRGHPHHRARRRQLPFRQRKAGAPRAGRPGQARAQPRHQCRMARLHDRTAATARRRCG